MTATLRRKLPDRQRGGRSAPGWLAACVIAFAASAGSRAADPPTAEEAAFFEKKIRPVLAKNCYSCHSGSVQARGGLRLDTKSGIQIGGQSGPAVNYKDLKKSKILAVLGYEGPEMPPAEKLPDEVVADFRKWVEMGAPDPRGEEVKYSPKRKINYAEHREEWVYQAPKKSPVPEIKGDSWSWSPIDQFVRTKQVSSSTRPVKDADPATWLRRVSFDLVGLPPTPAQIAAIERDSSRSAREKLVDELLASPQFGERWGRHWLDVARFAESTGKERNFVYAQAWRYRDWVIDALNADKPYDQFLREQIAGDLLPADSSTQRDSQVIATGFLSLGPKGVNERNRESYLLDIVDEQIENVGRAVLGLSVSCARCHDHKFDPITMQDYYGLAGIFRSSEARVGITNRTFISGQPDLLWTLPSQGGRATDLVDQELLVEIKKLERIWRTRLDTLRRARESASAEVLAQVAAVSSVTMDPLAGPTRPSDLEELPTETKQGPQPLPGSFEDIRGKQEALIAVSRKLNALKDRLARETAHATAIGMADLPEAKDVNIRLRGEADNVGPIAPRGFPQIISVAKPPAIGSKESGRRELAEWLVRPDHPLTSRVIANRLWAKLFGVGIVPTLDDFGEQGQKPTNAELLDYLAVRFIEQGWSVKKALKELVLTRTYQLSGADDAKNIAKDEANLTLWRWNRKRLDAESLRDASLAASHQLDLNRPNGSPVIELGLRELGPTADYGPIEQPSRYRSVYLPVLRSKPPEALAVFDLPDPSLVAGQRETTTSPGQALFQLNSPFALEQSEHLARHLLAAKGLDDAKRIDRAYQLLLSRHPSAAERERVLKFLAPAPKGVETDAQKLAAWTRFAQTLLALPEFRYLF